jgi:hypothetical protein
MAEHGSSLRHVPIEEPASGITKLTDAEFVARANRSTAVEQVTDDSPEAKRRNRARAQEELGLIAELRSTRSFQWFFDVCLRRNFKEARNAVETSGEDANSRTVAVRVTAMQQWRKAARWLIEREIEHRRLLDPKDPHLADLRKELEAY